MKFIKLWRTFKEGFKNFYRNGWLSFATISVLTLSLYVVSIVIMLGITANLLLKNVQDKVNVSVYFNPDVSEEQIIQTKSELEKYREIKSISYVSKDQALDEFLSGGGDNSAISQALKEIGENPLLSSLVIKANSPDQYDLITRAIQDSSFSDKISRINYEKNKTIIERLNSVIGLAKKAGLALGAIFVAISILITFNTIRITIYSHKQEFEIMSLVGASRMYVRMPFVFEGIFYGISASVASIALTLATAKFASPLVQGAIPQGGLVSLYFQHFFAISGSLLIFGVVLGVVSSFIAIRRYLKT
jgi:cell division transport system permease protein